ncbi:hypothetical protein [Microbacterium sp.]|uniref:hypothetical protein n=1 Tax=Microbacterium sp. TaxID=51671 RepID=UPI0039E4E7AA
MTSTFDERPLTEPVDRAAARAYVAELRKSGRAPAGTGPIGIVIGVAFAAVFLLVFGGVFASIFTTFLAVGSGSGAPGVLSFVPFVMIVLIIALIATLVWRFSRNSTAVRWYRLDRFARANGMQWHPEAINPPLPGMIFSLGRSRKATDIVRGAHPRFVEFGNYQYTTGSGKNQTTHKWGYVAVKLSTPLPHIVLDATSNNGLFGSNLPAAFNRDQRLSLEGDFDRHFSLYCPEGYEADALYLFTPDIMARFIDHAAALDVEIVDDWMFLYAKRDFSTLYPGTWAWLFSVVRAFLDKFAQWERWRDDRLAALAAPVVPTPGASANGPAGAADGAGTPGVAGPLPFVAPMAALRPPPGVAAPGRRLKQRFPWAIVIVFVAFLAFFLFGQAGVFAGFLSGLFR